MTKCKKTAELVEVRQEPGKTESQMIAELRLNPILRHAQMANSLAAQTVKFDGEGASAYDAGEMLREMADKVASGDMRHVSDALVSQSVMLDATVTELMRRAWQNAGEYPDAFHRYMTLALKAQTQSRTTLEALARLHQPREQIVRHVHVNDGGQAVIADQLHLNGPGGRNAAIADQTHGQGASVAALPRPDPLGNSVPVAGGARKEAVPDARRGKGDRRAGRQQKRAQARPADRRDAAAEGDPA